MKSWRGLRARDVSQGLLGIGLISIALTVGGCGGGGVGGACRDDRDCPRDGFCCESDKCDGGMCSFKCDGDSDCPRSTACEHGMCFEACVDNHDCGPDQKCKHDGVCEYD